MMTVWLAVETFPNLGTSQEAARNAGTSITRTGKGFFIMTTQDKAQWAVANYTLNAICEEDAIRAEMELAEESATNGEIDMLDEYVVTALAFAEAIFSETKFALANQIKFSVDGDIIAPIMQTFARVKSKALCITASLSGVEFTTRHDNFALRYTLGSDLVKVQNAGEAVIPTKQIAKIAAMIESDVRARYHFTASKQSPQDEGGTLKIADHDETPTRTIKLLAWLDGRAVKPPRCLFDGGKNKATISASELKTALAKVLPVTDNSRMAREFCKNVNFSSVCGALLLTAASLSTLVTTTPALDFTTATKNFNRNIRVDALNFIKPLLSNGEVTISYATPRRLIDYTVIEYNGWQISATNHLDKFPTFNFAEVLSNAPVTSTIATADLIPAVKLCKLFADESDAISLRFERDYLENGRGYHDGALVTGDNMHSAGAYPNAWEKCGRVSKWIEAKTDGAEFDFAIAHYNADKLLALCKAAGSQITFRLSKESAVIIGENLIAATRHVGGAKLPEKTMSQRLSTENTAENVAEFEMETVKVAS